MTYVDFTLIFFLINIKYLKLNLKFSKGKFGLYIWITRALLI